MTAQLESALTTVRELSHTDKIELFQFLARDLQIRDPFVRMNETFWTPYSLETGLREAPVIYQLNSLVADFWPADETADDFNSFVAARRRMDREPIL